MLSLRFHRLSALQQGCTMHMSNASKENKMNRYIMEEFYQDPALVRRLYNQAHLERVRALGAAFQWLRERLTPRLHLRDRLARLG
jgi:hypothetical protein